MSKPITDKNLIIKIKDAFSGIDRDLLAKKLKSSRNTIDQIAIGKLEVSALRAKEIEKATNGKILASILRPDIFDSASL